MNKPLFLLMACLLAASYLNAQTSKSNMMVGGSFEFGSNSYQGNPPVNHSSFHFSPSFGYFVNDNFALGVNMGLGRSRSGTDQTRTVNSSFSFGPFARYYFFTSNDGFAFFGNAQLLFGTNKSSQASEIISRGNSIYFGLSPGGAYFFNDHWAAEFTIGWLSITSRDPDTDRDNDKQTFVGFSISSFSPSLGVRYHF